MNGDDACHILNEPAHRLAGAWFGHDDLPDLNMPGAEGPGVGEEVVFPHPLENLVISSGESGPCF